MTETPRYQDLEDYEADALRDAVDAITTGIVIATESVDADGELPPEGQAAKDRLQRVLNALNEVYPRAVNDALNAAMGLDVDEYDEADEIEDLQAELGVDELRLVGSFEVRKALVEEEFAALGVPEPEDGVLGDPFAVKVEMLARHRGVTVNDLLADYEQRSRAEAGYAQLAEELWAEKGEDRW